MKIKLSNINVGKKTNSFLSKHSVSHVLLLIQYVFYAWFTDIFKVLQLPKLRKLNLLQTLTTFKIVFAFWSIGKSFLSLSSNRVCLRQNSKSFSFSLFPVGAANRIAVGTTAFANTCPIRLIKIKMRQ